MPRERNPNRDKAKEIWLEHNGDITNRKIAEILNEDEKVIAVWKSRDKWNVVQQSESNVVQHSKGKGGAPPGNQNALGNSGGQGGPFGNDKAVKHGLFRKYLPNDPKIQEIYDAAGQTSPLDLLWESIQIKFTNIIHSLEIMYVRNKNDLTKTLKREKQTDTGWEEEYELQQAWDKQASALNAQSRAMGQLTSMIRQYEEMCRLGWADEEQQLRVQKLKGEIAVLQQRATKDDDKPIEVIIKRKGDSS